MVKLAFPSQAAASRRSLYSNERRERPFFTPRFNHLREGSILVAAIAVFMLALIIHLLVTAPHADLALAGTPELMRLRLQAIDPDGHPVAGALVLETGKSLGVTDSFGEWRSRLIAFRHAGSLTVIKRRPNYTLTAFLDLNKQKPRELEGEEQVMRIQLKKIVP